MSDKLKSIDGRVLEHRRLSHNSDLIQQLNEYNVNLSTQDPEKLLGFIDGAPGYQDTMFRANCSTEENPCIILEHGASYCSLLVATDRQGNVVTLHIPIIGYNRSEILRELQLTGFTQLLNKNVSPDRTIFITATGAGTTAEERSELISNLEDIFDQSVNFLFLTDVPHNTERITPRSILRLVVRNLLRGLTDENMRLRSISNIFIVPSVCSTSDKTEIIIPSYPRGQIKVLSSAIRGIKEKLGLKK